MAVTNAVLAERIDNLCKTLDRVVEEFRENGKSAAADRRLMHEAQEDTNLRLQALESRMSTIEPHTQAFVVWREQARGAAKLARALPSLFGGALVAALVYIGTRISERF